MPIPKKRCKFYYAWFTPDARTAHQVCCDKPECRRQRKRAANIRINYAVCGRFTGGVKRMIAGVGQWRELDTEVQVAEIVFQAKSWSWGRRLVLIRQRNHEKDFVRGREMFDDPAWRYQGIFTDLPWPPEEVWRFYRKRATLETKIRELKWDYGIDGFCMKKFFATEAAFQAVCLAYNLMQQFQKELGFRTKRTLGVIRMMVLSCGAELVRAGRKLVLRLSVSGGRRLLFEEYAKRIFYWENGNCASVESAQKQAGNRRHSCTVKRGKTAGQNYPRLSLEKARGTEVLRLAKACRGGVREANDTTCPELA